MSNDPLPGLLADLAETIVNTLKHTNYQFTEHIIESEGIYDCDCSEFVDFVIQSVAPAHYGMIPCETDQPRPRAFEYYVFLVSKTPASDGGWKRVNLLQDAERGDIIAWRTPEVEAGEDTGHVLLVADKPELTDSGEFVVRVYDSSDIPHFEDTRGPGAGRFPNGVGSGFINFKVDAEGRPIAFLFSPDASVLVLPIVIGRIDRINS